MLCVASSRPRHVATAKRYLAAVVVAIGLGVQAAPAVFAVDEAVTVTVRDGLPSTIAVDQLPQSGVIQHSSITLQGTIHNVTQIMVYIDGVLYSTVPTTIGQSAYHIVVLLDPGQHVIKLLGIDAYTASQVETTLTVKYVPPDNTASPSTNSQATTEVVRTASRAAGELSQRANQQIDQASTRGTMKVMVDGVYGALSALGFITVRDGFGLTSPMLWRFVVMALGITLMLFPQGIYMLVRRFGLPARPSHPYRATIAFRSIGLIIFVLPILFTS